MSNLNVKNIFCIGRNYVAHAVELGNTVEEEPLVFLKPDSALLATGQPLHLPSWSSDVHYECELVLQIGKDADNIAEQDAMSVVSGYAIGLDLTARDVQSEAKKKGLPWTKAKGFRGAACLSDFVPAANVADPHALSFTLKINDELRQRGDVGLMVYSLPVLISYLSRIYGLRAGDIIYTGTPAGVGPLSVGDVCRVDLDGHVQAEWQVVA